jgi:hypothetical protein
MLVPKTMVELMGERDPIVSAVPQQHGEKNYQGKKSRDRDAG